MKEVHTHVCILSVFHFE